MEIKEGIIQRIKSDRKALAIENLWYNSFKPLDDSIKVGDNIKLVYSFKGDFKNIKSIEQIKDETKKITQDSIENSKELDSTSKNCIILTAKDLALEFKTIPFKNWVEEVRKIRENL